MYNRVHTAYRNRPVGKRTPRFQTSNASERRIRIIKASVSKLQNRVEEDSDSDVAAARTLVSKQSASPTASNTPSRRSLRQTSFQQNGDKVPLICYLSQCQNLVWFMNFATTSTFYFVFSSVYFVFSRV